MFGRFSRVRAILRMGRGAVKTPERMKARRTSSKDGISKGVLTLYVLLQYGGNLRQINKFPDI